MAQQRNQQPGVQGRQGNYSSSEDSMIVGQPIPNNRPVYNAPIGGTGYAVYAPPAMPVAALPVGMRPTVDTTKGTTTIRINLFNG